MKLDAFGLNLEPIAFGDSREVELYHAAMKVFATRFLTLTSESASKEPPSGLEAARVVFRALRTSAAYAELATDACESAAKKAAKD